MVLGASQGHGNRAPTRLTVRVRSPHPELSSGIPLPYPCPIFEHPQECSETRPRWVYSHVVNRYTLPDEKGYFGRFGGRYVPETLIRLWRN
jgi:hypothetical protein